MRSHGSRMLLPGEHYDVIEAHDEASFALIDAQGDLGTTWARTDATRPLQFLDIRTANRCEIQSLDEEPPGRDVPHP